MQETLTQKINEYPNWIKQFGFDPVYGYLIDPSYEPTSFDYKQIYEILKNLADLNSTKGIIEKINTMKEIKIDKKQNPPYKDMVILHDACSYLVHSYVKAAREEGKQEPEIVVPKNLATPLAFSASFLKVKIGMATGIGYNWYFKNQLKNLDDMTIEDIGIKSFYSKQPEHQGLFFAVSVTTSYCLSQIIRNCYEINCIIIEQPNLEDEVRLRMKNIRGFLKKIYEHNMNIQLKLDRQFFYYVLRIFVGGFQHIKFEGIEQRISSSGGAGGYDPSFQTFERAFGITFEGQLGTIQQKLRNGMPQPNRKLIDFMAQNSLLRQYCECSQQLQLMYNETIEAYVKYLQLHGTFIKNFIIHFMPINTTRSSFGATGATMIKIVDRFRFVRDQQF